MLGIGTTELLVIGVLALLLFGNRLPDAMRGMGRGFREFRDGVKGIDLEDAAR